MALLLVRASVAAFLVSAWPWNSLRPCAAHETKGGSHAACSKTIVGETGSFGFMRSWLRFPAGNWPEGQVGGGKERGAKQGLNIPPSWGQLLRPLREIFYGLDAPSMKLAMFAFNLARSSSRKYIMCPAS